MRKLLENLVQLSLAIYRESRYLFGVTPKILVMSMFCRYAQQSRSFVFFINEDGFVINVLTELLRALQAEEKTLVTNLNFLFVLFFPKKGICRIWIVTR